MYHAPPSLSSPPRNNASHQSIYESSTKQKKGATLNVAYVYSIARPIQNCSGMVVCPKEAENCLFEIFLAVVLIL